MHMIIFPESKPIAEIQLFNKKPPYMAKMIFFLPGIAKITNISYREICKCYILMVKLFVVMFYVGTVFAKQEGKFGNILEKVFQVSRAFGIPQIIFVFH